MWRGDVRVLEVRMVQGADGRLAPGPTVKLASFTVLGVSLEKLREQTIQKAHRYLSGRRAAISFGKRNESKHTQEIIVTVRAKA